MFVWRCRTCVAVLPDPSVARCPLCHENLKKHPPTVIGEARRDDWYRRMPWEHDDQAK